MACDEIGYSYLDPNDGVHKYVGSTGAVACASLNVFANLPEVPIMVSPDDDNGDGDGLTDFCRFYHVTGPVEVTLTAPQYAGTNNEQLFRKWVIDGVDQPLGQLEVSLIVGDGDCHVAFAKYGFVVGDPDPDSTCEGVEFSNICTLYGGVAYSLLPAGDAGSREYVQAHNSCWRMSPGPGGQQLEVQPPGPEPPGRLQYLRMPDPDEFCHPIAECCPPSCPIVFYRQPDPGDTPIWNTINTIRAHLQVGCSCADHEAAISLFNIGIGISGTSTSFFLPLPYCGPTGNTCFPRPSVGFGCGPFMPEFRKTGPGGSCPASAQRLLNTPFVMSRIQDLNFGSGPPRVRKHTQLQANF